MARYRSRLLGHLHDTYRLVHDRSSIDSNRTGFECNIDVSAAVDLFDLLTGLCCRTAFHSAVI